MAGHRLLLRELPDGISLLAQAAGSNALIALPQDEAFTFHLRIRNPDFALFTDLREFAGKTGPVYRNALSAGDDGILTLEDRESWNTETWIVPAAATQAKFTLAGNPMALDGDAQKLPEPADFSIMPPGGTAKVTGYDAAAKMIAIGPVVENQNISVRYRERIAPRSNILADVELSYDRSSTAPAFEIKFKVRAARWAYYLITDQTSGEFSIVDPDAPPLIFGADNRTVINGAGDQADILAATLSRQYPGCQLIRFLSDQPVRCSSAPRRKIELRLGDQKILDPLPNPSIRNLSRVKQQDKFQETFHQVIKFLKAS
ncbi:MAG: hypothetical protein ACKVP5_24135 [Aestuariivirga sp.]